MRKSIAVLISGMVFTTTMVKAQTLSNTTRDSLIALTCDIVKADQKYRQYPYSDSIAKAYRNKDTAAVYHFSDLLTRSDSTNFRILESIIQKYGFPGEKLLGKGACNLLTVFIHWQNGYPSWFNSQYIVKDFKREIQKGNMPVMMVDSPHAYFVKHTMHDLQYFKEMNAARKSYLLKQYTEQQFMREEPILPVKKD